MMVAAPCMHAEQWRLHPTYDGNVERLIDTPDYLYVLSYSQGYYPGTRDNGTKIFSLFRYEKDGDEIVSLDKSNLLSDYIISLAEYNKDKKYLCVVYTNGNIDLVYDNGKVVNIPGLKIADMEFDKHANGIYFSPESDEILIATDFGFISVDDAKGDIKYTRNFRKSFTGVAKIGSNIYLSCTDGLYRGTSGDYGFDGYEKCGEYENIGRLVRLDNDKFLLYEGEGWWAGVWGMTESASGELTGERLVRSYIKSIEPGKDVVVVSGYDTVWDISHDFSVKSCEKDSDDKDTWVGSWDGRNYWYNLGRDGLALKTPVSDGNWTVTKSSIFPNASTAYKVDKMVYHPTYGMLIRNHGISSVLTSQEVPTPDLLSGYKGLTWTPLSTTYNAPSDMFLQWNPNGVAVDPKNSDHVYSGSFLHGMLRLDMANPENSLRIGREGDAGNGLGNGYVGVFPDMSTFPLLSNFSAPGFDNNGTLWVAWYNHDANQAKQKSGELWFWTADDRLASKDASSYRALKRMPLTKIDGSASQTVVPLRSSSSKNLLVFSQGSYKGELAVIDHKGTLDSDADDETAVSGKIYDQDGTSVDYNYLTCFFEDTSTGLVWVGTDRGVFTFRPSEFLKNPERVNRVKVARNDGTNLADYLLDGVPVNCITNDPSGRKWFSTSGGGVVCTSADGTEVLKTYTTDNSELPDNTTYALCYNPENNSMMISTDCGLAELFLTTSAVDGEKSKVVAYPNPVRPDYFGYVTIEGLADNALVKIVDSAGYLIKEIGLAAGGEARWDVTNMNAKRVPSGVYHVLASGGPNQDSYSKVAKILVVN